ncbi:hypothetical protein GY45DRAFT_1376144 [Cubamyces sp. BRFM 1775]|nr:hypothetical protein GY45DRAFT_1376144 [Cubamyces sp. BRFM 1775]
MQSELTEPSSTLLGTQVRAVTLSLKDSSNIGRRDIEIYEETRPPSHTLGIGDDIEIKIETSDEASEHAGAEGVARRSVKGRICGVRRLDMQKVELIIKNEDTKATVRSAILRLDLPQSAWNDMTLATKLRQQLEELGEGRPRDSNGRQGPKPSGGRQESSRDPRPEPMGLDGEERRGRLKRRFEERERQTEVGLWKKLRPAVFEDDLCPTGDEETLRTCAVEPAAAMGTAERGCAEPALCEDGAGLERGAESYVPDAMASRWLTNGASGNGCNVTACVLRGGDEPAPTRDAGMTGRTWTGTPSVPPVLGRGVESASQNSSSSTATSAIAETLWVHPQLPVSLPPLPPSWNTGPWPSLLHHPSPRRVHEWNSTSWYRKVDTVVQRDRTPAQPNGSSRLSPVPPEGFGEALTGTSMTREELVAASCDPNGGSSGKGSRSQNVYKPNRP